MAKKKIYVNRDYEQAFNSIYNLIQGGCLDGAGWKVNNEIIDDGVYEYQLSSVYTGKDKTEKHGFNSDGATWFKALRGVNVENNDAIWTSFIETVGVEYHKRYSVVEYQQQTKTLAEKKKALAENKEMVDQFIKLFYPDFYKKTEIVEVEGEETVEDIYGVAMRIELSGGTGASLPVLCKVYFSKAGRTVTPLSSYAAQNIDDNLSEIIPEETNNNQEISGEAIIDTTLNAVDNLINDSKFNFADFICYSDKADRIAVDNLLSQLSHDAVELECQRVDVLYITHVKASSFLYNVNYLGKPLFKFNNGLNKALTLYCANCNDDEKLVDSNHLVYEVNGEMKTAILQLGVDDFGLTSQQIDEINESGQLKNHYIKVSCHIPSRGQECKTLKCKSQLFSVNVGDESNEKLVCKCKDCPYPEVVYTTPLGEKKYTPAMTFAKDVMCLVDTRNEDGLQVEKCSVCGRYFTKGSLKYNKCHTCFVAENGSGTLEQVELYNKYKGLLPLGARMGAISEKKFCVEDEEIILFVLGTKKYVFNKLSVKEKGYFEEPRKIF